MAFWGKICGWLTIFWHKKCFCKAHKVIIKGIIDPFHFIIYIVYKTLDLTN